MRVNKRKRPNTRDCDRTGTVKIGGVEYWANGWIQKDRETGEKYLSLSFRPKAPKPATQSQFPAPAPEHDAEGPLPAVPAAPKEGEFWGGGR